ncbi:hypothetical protein [Pedobacter psychrotolerans]|uniref:hypothetical protein n=1 Tax=Pedobacter psychrotolerans TaxID=1843235 RepID=UPI001E2EC0F4|nr:hypothetical protein [Pedobacter psychrotolerans]
MAGQLAISIIIVVGKETHPLFVSLDKIVWLPTSTLLNTVEAWYVPPSILYSKPEPVGALIVMVPVAEVQVGCTAVAIGAAGVAGCALIVILVEAEVQPSLFLTVTE